MESYLKMQIAMNNDIIDDNDEQDNDNHDNVNNDSANGDKEK